MFYSGFLLSRTKGCMVYIHILIISACLTECMTKKHHTNRLLMSKGSAEELVPSLVSTADNGETASSDMDIDVVNGTVRSRPQGMTDSRWSEMSMQEKIQFWNQESNNGIKVLHTTVTNEIIPKAKELNISPTQIEALQRNVDALKDKGTEIEKGDHTEEFHALYKKQDNGVAKLLDRSTPVIQQKAERALDAVQAIGEGVKKIKANWGVPGKEWEMISDVSTMLSGVLAVIPTPQTKILAVFLDVVSSLIGIFSPSTQATVSDYINKAVDAIIRRFNQENVVENRANLVMLTNWWRYLTEIIDGCMTAKQFSNYIENNNIPDFGAHVIPIERAKEWAGLNLQSGEDGENTKLIVQQYYRMCKLMDQMFQRIIQLMPRDAESGYDNVRKGYIMNKDTLRKSAFQWTKANTFVLNRFSMITLQHLFPPEHNRDSKELFDFIKNLSYMEDNKVIAMTDIPEAPTGNFYLESAEYPGWYVYLASDWNDYTERLVQNEWEMGYSNARTPMPVEKIKRTENLDLGVMITLYQKSKSKIRFSSVSSRPDVRTMTVTRDSANITYLDSFHPRSPWRAAEPHNRNDVPIFAPTSNKPTKTGVGITTNQYWRVIPLEREEGRSETPVMIGDADGTSFLCVDDKYKWYSQSAIYLTPLNPERVGDKHRVRNRNIFYLKAARRK